MSLMAESETYSEEETERRREAALKRMLKTPPKPHKPARRSIASGLYVIPCGMHQAADFDLMRFKAPQ
ncbi:hypothetical protein [Altererythrobacter sp. C41]|uniref:hypothetical protein n=1 Tax=Altererythrobacter sp. C41 TaxID=2806021 RepID=UPI0019336D44|nr:hypothetical protein [Altererythrobacter sp. C41]MBM0170089.1 hypothetical protein [Altererythrobacter sp. C41]